MENKHKNLEKTMINALKTAENQILIADDRSDIRETLARALSMKGLDSDLVDCPDEAVAMAQTKPYLAVVIDLQFTNYGVEGYSVLERTKNLPTKRILYTGRRNFETITEGLSKGADYVVLNKDQSELLSILEEIKFKEMKGGK